MTRLRLILIAIMTSLTLVLGAATMWEEVDRLPVRPEAIQADQDEVITLVSDSWIYVALRERHTVKVFTIVGQPVSQQTLEPGTYRLRLPARGIYLLKIGSLTRRVIS